MIKNPKIDTALHILKGAVEKTIGANITSGVYEEGNNGRLTVDFDRKPTEKEMVEIEKLANEKILENVSVENFEIDRQEAEEKFGNKIYDKFPVPPHVKRLKIVNILDWNINCCLGNHTKSTGEIGKIEITKIKFRNAKQQLEIGFRIED